MSTHVSRFLGTAACTRTTAAACTCAHGTATSLLLLLLLLLLQAVLEVMMVAQHAAVRPALPATGPTKAPTATGSFS